MPRCQSTGRLLRLVCILIAIAILTFAATGARRSNLRFIESFKEFIGATAPQTARTVQADVKTDQAVAPLSAISLTTFGSAYTQDFNTLASSGSSSTVPAGWAFSEAGPAADTTYTAGNGSLSTGDTYSFGTTASTDRAFGSLQGSSLDSTIGASFINNTGSTVSSLSISYTGEQWRLGSNGSTDRLDFQYSTNATSLSNGTWTDVNALDFPVPNPNAAVGALDGNAAGNRTAISSSISGLSIPDGATFWIRWKDLSVPGADDGLSIDDFSLTANATSAAGASVSGQVRTPNGDGVGNALVTIGGGPLSQPITLPTSPFGYYSFKDVPVGHTYIITVASKRFRFAEPSRVVSVMNSVADFDFTAEP